MKYTLCAFALLISASAFSYTLESSDFENDDCFKCYAEDASGDKWSGVGSTKSRAKSKAVQSCERQSHAADTCEATNCSFIRRQC